MKARRTRQINAESMNNEKEGYTLVTDKSQCFDCRFGSSNGRQLYSLSWPVHFVLHLAKCAYPHWHTDASEWSHQSPSSTSAVASRGLRANHRGINCRATEIMEMMERWKMYWNILWKRCYISWAGGSELVGPQDFKGLHDSSGYSPRLRDPN